MAKAATRIYLVTTPNRQHLIEAATQAQAIHHVTKRTITAAVLSAKEALKSKLDLEVASPEVSAEQGALPLDPPPASASPDPLGS